MKCSFCGKPLPEPGCDTVMVVETLRGLERAFTCVQCQKAGRRPIVRLHKVRQANE